MTVADLEQQIRAIAEELVRLHKRMPDMNGSDFARDHGWISQADHAADEAAADRVHTLATQELSRIAELREQYPVVFAEFMQTLLDDLLTELDGLNDRYPASSQKSVSAAPESRASSARFLQSLLPSIIKCLQDWQAGITPQHWPGWAWRVVFSSLDQARQLIK